MTPYKSFISAAQAFFNSNAFLRFLLAAYIFIFAAGGLFYLLGLFIVQVMEAFITLGSILIWAGLVLSLIKEDALTILISSGTIALGSLVGWIISLAGRSYYGFATGGVFAFTPFLFFLIFGAIAIIVPIRSEKFKAMRAASAARAAGVACPRCGGFVSMASAFCPNCGAPRPAVQYAPPQPQYAPPVQPQYAPPQPQYAPPAAPAPPVQPPVAPAAPTPPAAPVEAESAAEPAGRKCVACGAPLPEGAAFCGKCGSKQ